MSGKTREAQHASGNELSMRTPDDHLIEVFIGDVESLYSLAFQINATGEETVELHNFVAGVIAGDIEVQDGVSIRGLEQMAAIVGDSLKPTGRILPGVLGVDRPLRRCMSICRHRHRKDART